MMKSTIDIQSLHKSITNIGKIIKSTKKKYTWEFILEDKIFVLDLLVSKITSKYRIIINNEKIFEKKNKNNFFFEFHLQLHTITIKQREDFYVLLIDGFLFHQKDKKKKTQELKKNNSLDVNNFYNNENNKKKQNCLCQKKKKFLKPVKSESLIIVIRSDYSNFSDFSFNSNSDNDNSQK